MHSIKRILRRFYYFLRGQMARLEAKSFLKLGLVLFALLFLWYVADGVLGSAGLTRYGILRDYRIIWDTLETEMHSESASERVHADALRAKYYKKIFFCPTEKAFYNLCQELFSELGNPGGVRLINPGEYVYRTEKYLSFYPGGYNGYYRLKNIYGIQDARFETFADKKTMDNYTKYAAQGIGTEDLADEAEQIHAEILIPDKAAIIYIPSMSARRITVDRQKLLVIYKTLEHFENVAFHLKDEGDGDPRYWKELIVRPNISSVLSCKIPWMYKSSQLADAFIPNKDEGEILFGKTMQDYLKKERTEAPPTVFDRVYLEKIEVSNETGAALKGKLWFFIDENTKYAAEGFARFCKITDFAILLGQDSGGEGFCGAGEVSVSLPKSKLIMRFSALYSINDSGIHGGGENFPLHTIPDVYTDKSENLDAGFLEAVKVDANQTK